MAKKGVKKTAKKKVAKKVSKKPVKKKNSSTIRKAPSKSMSHVSHSQTHHHNSKAMPMRVRATPTKFRLVLKNLILFVILGIISWLLYAVSGNVAYQTFFYVLTMILGFISLAFLISLIILAFLKLMRK